MSPFDRSDWDQFSERVRRDSFKSNERDLKVLAQAAVSMDALTGDPNWDAYLQMIQQWIEDRTVALEDLKNRSIESPAVSHEDLLKERIQAKIYYAEIQVLMQVIQLPAELRKKGMEARKALSELKSE